MQWKQNIEDASQSYTVATINSNTNVIVHLSAKNEQCKTNNKLKLYAKTVHKHKKTKCRMLKIV